MNTLNTTWIPELGAPGTAGGGQGGTGSFETTTSTAQGGPGTGAFGSGLGGGFGGETGWSNASAINARRGAGGGGGRFGDALPDPAGHGFLQIVIGADAEPGFDNLQGENGAISGLGMPPKGGSVGASPFTDSDPANDHYGLLNDRTTGAVGPGELLTPWAGAGGGAGGDAARVTPGNVFPQVPFSANGDEKGAGGGGGGGSVHIMALGPIVFGPQGQINARGGTGGGGENTIFLNRVGGGSGGGSGGHVVLETASHIDLSAVTSGTALLATGGQGGAGKDDKGGAFRSNNGIKETTPSKDACPPGQVGCLGHVEGAGGDGGPGLIQLHVPLSDRPTAGLRLAPGTTLGDVAYPPPVGAGSNAQLLPTFLGATGSAEVGTRARRLNGEALRYRPGLGLRLRFE